MNVYSLTQVTVMRENNNLKLEKAELKRTRAKLLRAENRGFTKRSPEEILLLAKNQSS